jgi:enamine deaminase RidA (YjgF/YER057c/UK114 family)
MNKLSIFIVVLLLLSASLIASLHAETKQPAVERINPPTLYETFAYTQVTTVPAGKKLVFVAGQTGRTLNAEGPNTEENSDACAHSDMRGQYIVTMENVGKALAAAEATWDDVVYIRKFTTDMDAFLEASQSMPSYWSAGKAPASTLIGVASLADPCFMVEVDVTAVVDSD